MSIDNLVLVISSIAVITTPCLIALNNIRVNAENLKINPSKREPIIVDYMTYVREKSKGDVVDQSIAERLFIQDLVA